MTFTFLFVFPSCSSMAPPVSLQAECEPFWKGYRFRSSTKEEQYRKQLQPRMVYVCQLWCCCHLVLDGLVPLNSKVMNPTRPQIWLSFLPHLALAITTLLLVSAVPLLRRHIIMIISVAAVLMNAAAAWQVPEGGPITKCQGLQYLETPPTPPLRYRERWCCLSCMTCQHFIHTTAFIRRFWQCILLDRQVHHQRNCIPKNW